MSNRRCRINQTGGVPEEVILSVGQNTAYIQICSAPNRNCKSRLIFVDFLVMLRTIQALREVEVASLMCECLIQRLKVC